MSRAPVLTVLALYALLFGFLASFEAGLPDPMAIHFDIRGRPDGWLSRRATMAVMAGFAVAFPPFILALVAVGRRLARLGGVAAVRDPTAADEGPPVARRRDSVAFRLACLALCFVIGVDFLVVHANRTSPHRFSVAGLVALDLLMVVGLAKILGRRMPAG